MKAIEISAKTDKQGLLTINYPLYKKERNVRVIILVDEKNETDEEKLWLSSISSNPAFDFLKDQKEDNYSLTDGRSINN